MENKENLNETLNEEVKEEKVVEEQKPTKEDKKEKKDKFKKALEEKDAEIEKVKEQLEFYKDKYYRSIADLDNQRKQYEKEYRQTLKYASQNLAEKLIPSFEMFSMVIEMADKLPPEVSAYVQGFDMIYKQMIMALESEGIVEIPCKVNDEFDHNIHSAMETQEVEDEALVNKIVKVIRKGYKIHDRLIRPTTVVVGKTKEVSEQKDNEENNTQADA